MSSSCDQPRKARLLNLISSPQRLHWNVVVCIPGFEPDGLGGCQPCNFNFFKEDGSNATCTACSTIENNTVTVSVGSNSSDLCGTNYSI